MNRLWMFYYSAPFWKLQGVLSKVKIIWRKSLLSCQITENVILVKRNTLWDFCCCISTFRTPKFQWSNTILCGMYPGSNTDFVNMRNFFILFSEICGHIAAQAEFPCNNSGHHGFLHRHLQFSRTVSGVWIYCLGRILGWLPIAL